MPEAQLEEAKKFEALLAERLCETGDDTPYAELVEELQEEHEGVLVFSGFTQKTWDQIYGPPGVGGEDEADKTTGTESTKVTDVPSVSRTSAADATSVTDATSLAETTSQADATSQDEEVVATSTSEGGAWQVKATAGAMVAAVIGAAML